MKIGITTSENIPKPPSSNPRWEMTLEKQKRFTSSGEYIRFEAIDLLSEPKVKIAYPSGYMEQLLWNDFERLLRINLGLVDWKERTNLISYLTNFRRTAYFPSEKIHKIILRLPDDSEALV